VEKRCINCGLAESLIENVSTNVTTKEIMCWDCNVHKNRYADDKDEREEKTIIYKLDKTQFDTLSKRLGSMDQELEYITSNLRYIGGVLKSIEERELNEKALTKRNQKTKPT
jgi:hypothetical protein